MGRTKEEAEENARKRPCSQGQGTTRIKVKDRVPQPVNARVESALEHLLGQPFKESLGIPDVRHRRGKDATTQVLTRRLLSLDYLIERPGLRWLGIVRLIRLDPKNLQSRTIRLQVDATRPGRRLGLV